MPSAATMILLATLGAALAGQSAASVVLWRRLRARAARAEASGLATAGRVDELERRAEALEARLAKAEAMASSPFPLGPRVRRRFDRAGPTLISVPNLAAPPSPAREAASGLGRRFGEVWALADAGAPAEVVARETGYPVGQVELILGLRRRAVGEGRADA